MMINRNQPKPFLQWNAGTMKQSGLPGTKITAAMIAVETIFRWIPMNERLIAMRAKNALWPQRLIEAMLATAIRGKAVINLLQCQHQKTPAG